MTTGEHIHCFCTQDTSGNIVCCRCGTALINCNICPVPVCEVRTWLGRNSPGPVFQIDCPLASGKYNLLYSRAWAV